MVDNLIKSGKVFVKKRKNGIKKANLSTNYEIFLKRAKVIHIYFRYASGDKCINAIFWGYKKVARLFFTERFESARKLPKWCW